MQLQKAYDKCSLWLPPISKIKIPHKINQPDGQRAVLNCSMGEGPPKRYMWGLVCSFPGLEQPQSSFGSLARCASLDGPPARYLGLLWTGPTDPSDQDLHESRGEPPSSLVRLYLIEIHVSFFTCHYNEFCRFPL